MREPSTLIDIKKPKKIRFSSEPDDVQLGLELILDGETYYYQLQDLRNKTQRNVDFMAGKQWGGMIEDPDTGELITEHELHIRQGRTPMINNQVMQIVKNIMGQYRDNDYKPEVAARRPEDTDKVAMITNALHSVYDVNDLKEVDAQHLMYFLASAIFCQKVSYDYFEEMDQPDVCIENLELNEFCFNTDIRDIRLKDLKLFCRIIDAPIDSLMNTFCETREEREKMLEWYGTAALHRVDAYSDRESFLREEKNFLLPVYPHLARVLEFWRKEEKLKVMVHDPLTSDFYQHPLFDPEEAIAQIEEENNNRIKEFEALIAQQALANGIVPILDVERDRSIMMSLGSTDEEFTEALTTWTKYLLDSGIEDVPLLEFDQTPEFVWMYYLVTPLGYIIDSGETPYTHQGIPYVLRIFPMIQGLALPFIGDFVDQQRQVNRLLSQIDYISSVSAKGGMMLAEEHIPEGWDEERYAGQYAKAGGVMVFNGDSIRDFGWPQQIRENAMPATQTQLLSIQMDLMSQISGVSEAIQGHAAPSGTPASRYQQEAANSTISSKNMFEFFFNARKNRDYKIVKTFQQHYNENRHLNISGMQSTKEGMYEADIARDIPIRLVITKSASAPIYRNVMDAYLSSWLENGLINMDIFLDNTSLPFAQSIKEQIAQMRESAAQQQAQIPVQ